MSSAPPTFAGHLVQTDGSTVDVRIQCLGRMLTLSGPGISRAIPLIQIGHSSRDDGSVELTLDDATRVIVSNGHAWQSVVGFGDEGPADAPTTVAGDPNTAVVPAIQPGSQAASWVQLAVLGAAALAIVVLLYVYAIPAVGRLIAGLVPVSVDAAIGDAMFESLDRTELQPSGLPIAQRSTLRTALDRAVATADGTGAARTAIEFRRADMGPNAFALPGGRIVVTDELVTLVDGREDVVVGVLGHEYGHVKARHGVKTVAQSALLTTLIGAVFGDVSGLLAGAPQVLGEQAYSRDFEREADAEAVRVLRAGGYRPDAMVVFFDKLAEHKQTTGRGLAIAFASHPADAERIRFFKEAASTP